MLNWDEEGLAFVTSTPPTTSGHPGQYAWAVMTDVLADPANKALHSVSEDLATWDEDKFTHKKDHHY